MKRNKEKRASIEGDAVAEKMAKHIVDRQRALAKYLNRKTKNIPRKVWLAMLIGFCAVFGSYCALLLFRAMELF